MLKKRKTPISQLFAEREGIRIYPITNENMITISQLKLNQMVLIGNELYYYTGQHTIKKQGFKKSVYQFKCLSMEVKKEYPVNQAPTFRKEQDILKMI